MSKQDNNPTSPTEEEKVAVPENEQVQAENEQSQEEKTEEQPAEKTDAEKLAEAEEEIAALKDKYLRQVAEFDNYRKRTMKEKAELILNGGEKVMQALLPILDDLERALDNIGKSDNVETLREGVDLIFSKLQKALAGQGLKRIETDGQDFNTDFHEAIALVPVEENEKKGKIIDCVQSGYLLNDKVIRHAKVAVGQ